MTPEVEQAIAEIRQAFPEHTVEVQPESQGGAYIIVHNLLIGEQYTPSTSWIGFLLSFQYPYADVYPLFMDSMVHRADGQAWGTGLSSPVSWNNRNTVQISRRANPWNPAVDTAATKLAKVLAWLRSL